jgi:uncharacterized protein
VTRIAELPADAWNALAGDSPFVQHAFLHALEATGCVGAEIGWEPVHLALFRGDQLEAAMPLYVKHHSWGEFVFDWAWADAYRRHGLAYYPKLVCCAPFSPVPGPRLLAKNDADRATLIQAALKLTRDLNCSSFHILFPTEPDHAALNALPLLHRSGFQFHWNNAGYGSFDDFLAALTHDKRKKIRQERKKLNTLGVTFRWVEGAASSDADWDHFYRCYADTYARHRSEPHLNRAFFANLRETMPDNLLLIIADKDGEPVACSFCIKDGQRLYGRHWGTLEYVPGLHFETCYQQGIEYAIAKGSAGVRRRRAGRTQAVARAGAHHHAFLALAGKRRVPRSGRPLPGTRNRCHRALHGRTGRPVPPRAACRPETLSFRHARHCGRIRADRKS